MTGLEQTFYIMAIIFMSVMFVMIIALVAAIFAIRAKINEIHDRIEDRLDMVTAWAEKGGELTAMAGRQVVKRAKKALKQ
jgi:cell division protein FtsL